MSSPRSHVGELGSEQGTSMAPTVENPQMGLPSPLQQAGGGGSDPSRVLVPFNGSPVARKALDVAANLGRGRSGVVWVLYVRPWDVGRGGTRFCLETPDEARSCAQEAVAELRRRGVSASAVVRDARREKVAQAIAAEAERLEVGCIVLGTHARGAIGLALLGSTSHTVARTAARPIILVKSPDLPRGQRTTRRSRRALDSDTQD